MLVSRDSIRLAFLRMPVAAVVLFAATACGGEAKNETAADSMVATAGATTSAGPDTGMAGMAGMDHSNMAGMTGNADQDFLRMMSDHHKGLVAWAHMTKDGKGSTEAVRADARKLDNAQDADLDTMTTMLETSFKDAYQPKILPMHQAMADSLRALSGAAYDRTFYHHVIQHHQDGLKMMDEYLPKLTRPELKAMVQRMKDAHAREITEFERKMNAMK
ncbi:MAG: DUF305 domain-containing protein [Gemmatimonas sp.]